MQQIMKCPSLTFKYRWLFDQLFNKPTHQPLQSEMRRARDLVIKFNKKYQVECLMFVRQISKITGLKWCEKNIDIYFINHRHSFSDPLSINITGKGVEYIKYIFIHEMIHRIFIQSDYNRVFGAYWRKLQRSFPNLSMGTIYHIPLDAFISLIYRNQPSKLMKIKKFDKKLGADYLMAWQIVEREGFKKIIFQFKKEVTSSATSRRYLAMTRG